MYLTDDLTVVPPFSTRRSPAAAPTTWKRSAPSATLPGLARRDPRPPPERPSNGPTEGLNLCVKRVKRCGHGSSGSSTTACACYFTPAVLPGPVDQGHRAFEPALRNEREGPDKPPLTRFSQPIDYGWKASSVGSFGSLADVAAPTQVGRPSTRLEIDP